MKKIVLFLTIIMFAFTGIVFACNEDRYADLKISVSSVVSQTSGNGIKFNEAENCYEVMYGETFVVDANVTCSNDISKSLIFRSESSESLNHIQGLDTDTESGTRATFKAVAPSYDKFFKISIISYEATNKSKTVQVKVILPLERIDLKQNLGLTYGNDIDLNNQVIYKNAIASDYETNEKGANFVLKSFEYFDKDNVKQIKNLVTDDFVNYGLERKADDTFDTAFKVVKGVVSAVDKTLEGNLIVEAKSIKFDSSLEELEKQAAEGNLELSAEQQAQIAENNDKFKAQTSVNVIKGLYAQDISFVGGQIGFIANNQQVKSKLNASLYINSTDTYKLNDNKNYYYNVEKINLNIATFQQIKLDVVVGDAIVNGKPVSSDKGVISNINSDDIKLDEIKEISGAAEKVVGYNTSLSFNADGSNGNAYVDFVVTYTGFDNKIQYKFSDLYAKYLETLSTEQLQNVDKEHSTLAINCSALPSAIAVSQDAKNVELGSSSMIKIFDSYKDGAKSSYGTKLDVKLTLSSGLTSFKINEQNRIVRVYLKHSYVSNVNVNEYIEIRNANKNRITLSPIERTLYDSNNLPYTENVYYFDLDLANEQTSYFYAKANKANLSVSSPNYIFEFENLLGSSISTFSGEEVLPNTSSTTLKNLTALLNAKTVRGVEDIIGVVKGGEDYYRVDSNNLSAEPIYQQMILKYNPAEQVTERSGSLLGVFVNESVDELLDIKVLDNSVVKIFEVSSDGLFDAYLTDYNKAVEDYNKTLSQSELAKFKIQFNKSYAIVGTRVGTTTIEISSENGYNAIIKVDVINPISDTGRDFKVEAKQGYSKIVYENYLDRQSNPYLSAKVNGKFNLVWSATPDKSGVINVRYNVYKLGTTEKSNVLVVDNNTGLVTTKEVGKATVVLTMNYYVFDNTSGYYEWTSTSYDKSFTFEIFEPATMYRLTNNGISNVYSYDSLGYEDKNQSRINIGVIISPSNATINNLKDTAIKFTVDANSKNLRGANGFYTAYLEEGQNRATEYVTVSITEFGYTTTLKYTVNIYRATQIEDIDAVIFEGEKEVTQKQFSFDEETISIKTTKNKTLLFNTTISPNKVYNDNLVVKVFKAQDSIYHDFTTEEFPEEDSYAVLSYNNQKGQTIELDSGRDRFTLQTSSTKAGYFYVVIFAKDSMTSKNTGLVYQRYIIEITDGSLSSPYVIETASDLMNVANDPAKHYVLGADINLSFISNWTPIANFSGSLNGYNISVKEKGDAEGYGTFYKITGLRINSIGSGYVGLFEKILIDPTTESTGTVMNLGLEVESINLTKKSVDATFVDETVAIGAIAGLNNGIISNCEVKFNDISVYVENSDASVGGVVGINNGGIFNFPHEGGLASINFGEKIINKNFIDSYSENYVYKTTSITSDFVSTNPINGNIFVKDSEDFKVYTGGITGSNFGIINGVYGVYTYIEEQLIADSSLSLDVNYLTAYQSQGTDVKVNINNKDAENYELTNIYSAVGGVVGFNRNAKIVNVSSDVNIGYNVEDEIKGVKNHVGGIVGSAQISQPEAEENNLIFNVLVSGKIRANDMVGGVIGTGNTVTIERARVENYERITEEGKTYDKYYQSMIVANNYIGGVAGLLSSSSIQTAYSHSYVSLFNEYIIENPDIVSVSQDASIGGIVGVIQLFDSDRNSTINAVYSTFGLKTVSATAEIAGIVGSLYSEEYDLPITATISNAYYIGVINTPTVVNENNCLVNFGEKSQSIQGYYFYYILKYVDSSDVENGTNYDSVICVLEHEGDLAALNADNANYFNSEINDKIYNFEVSVVEGNTVAEDKRTISTKVLAYTSNGYKYNFVKNVPDDISVTSKLDSDKQVEDFVLKLTDVANDYFYYYYDEDGLLHIIARYSVLNNTFELNDLFNVIPSPKIAGKLNILVNAIQNQDIISITDNGNLVINKIGSLVLQFTVRENISSKTYVYFDIVKSFDELMLSNLTNFKTSIIRPESDPINTRKLTDVNVYSLFGEFVDDSLINGKIVYKTIEKDGKTLYLIQIDQFSFYTLSLDIKYFDGNDYIVDTTAFELEGNTFRFINEGLYQVKVSVKFNLLDGNGSSQEYYFVNDAWVTYFNVYSGATAIKFDTQSFGLTGNNLKTDLKLTLITDESFDEDEELSESFDRIKVYVVTDSNTRYDLIYFKDEENGVVRGEGYKFTATNEDNIIYMELTNVSHQGQSHTYTFIVGINDDYRYINRIRTFNIYAYDVSVDVLGNKNSVFENNPASVSVSLNPKGLNGVSAVHYSYTQKASKIETDANTNSEFGNENINFSYSFTSEPKNSVVAGNEGLFVVDVTPYYSNITSISIQSSLSSLSGNALQFVQLVKIKGNGDDYYIYAPQTSATEDGRGIYLNKFSYIPSDIAELSVSDKQYTIEMLSDKVIYGFGKNFYTKTGELFNYTGDRYDDYVMDSEVGRLYVKTVAPTYLEVEESFEVYVTVKYEALDENGVLKEYEELYTHKLFVESIPGLDVSINNNGKERNIIAYTGDDPSDKGSDYLDIMPIVDKGYTFKSITGMLYQTSDPNKDIYSNGINTIDYFTLMDLPNGVGKRLKLGTSASVGDTIILTINISIEFEGYVESRLHNFTIRVVDVVIDDITVRDLNAEDKLKITVSTSKQLKVVIDGYGTKEAIQDAENAISRSVDYDSNTVNYWFAKSQRTGEYYVNLDSANIKNDIPFNVQKLAITNEKKSVNVSGSCIGANTNEQERTVDVLPKLVVLEGSTSAGIVDMQLKVSYVYLDKEDRSREDVINAGQIVFVPNSFSTSFTCQKYFKVEVTEDSNEDHPTPIYTAEKFEEYLNAATDGNFILMNDITLSHHTATKANFESFDGNNKIITIESFAYNPNLVSSSGTTYTINMGLFDTVSQNTTIKNVIVALPNDKTSPMNLKGYTAVNFGGIAAVNEGVITNCDVVTITEQQNSNLYNYENYDYTLNFETSMMINGADVTANIGLLVGDNKNTGFITNSRVGRESMDVLTVYDSEATVVYKNKYAYTAPMTLVKVYGRANVGGFVASNSGTISSSYVKNLQLEVNSVSSKDFVKTGGFVVTNKGFIHGSYVAGWEEEGIKGTAPNNRKLGGGIYSNGFIGGFVYRNESYIEDCYSNINLSGNLTHAAQTSYIKYLTSGEDAENAKWISPAVGGFVYTSTEGSFITTSYSLSKISTEQDASIRSNTHAAFEGRMESADVNFVNEGVITNSYFMVEKDETFSYDHEQATKLTDNPSISLDNNEEASGVNEFINKGSFNSFSFDNDIENYRTYEGTSTGGVWAIYSANDYGYPELISANKIAISARVINVTKTNNSETNLFYYTYVDGYDIGSINNPYLISNFDQYNNIFKDAIGKDSFNDNVTTKFTGNIRLIKNINFDNSEEVFSTSIEYTSLINQTSVFDGNYLAMYNISLADKSNNRDSFGLFKDIYYAGVKNLTLVVNRVDAGNTTSVGALAGVIANSNISNVTLAASNTSSTDAVVGAVIGNNYVGALAGIIVSNDLENVYTVSNVKSNLSIVGSVSPAEDVNAITTSSIVWERIKPSATSSGLSAVNANLRLHKLPINVYYAGGIAGIIDLHQVVEIEDNFELNNVNAYNIHVGKFKPNTILSSSYVNYDSNVSVNSDYSGGLFGLIGSQTYLEVSEFIAQEDSEDHFISARQIAGGIVAVNFGKVSQSYVSFEEQDVIQLDKALINYVTTNSQEKIRNNSTLFSYGYSSPKYIGGIAGINVGNGEFGSGNITDCYSRVDVKNVKAIGVGGIVGGAYIGQISNVYSTGSLMGDLTRPSVTKIGAIIGKIFEDADEGYFADYHGVNTDNDHLALSNIVAVNLWDTADFDVLYSYVKAGGKIGSLYGEYTNVVSDDDDDDESFIKLTQGVYVQGHVLKDYTDARILEEEFNIGMLSPDTYFGLWGAGDTDTINYDKYLNERLGSAMSSEFIIKANNFRALLSSPTSTLRETYFSPNRWSRAIWNYDRYFNDDSSQPKMLPVLDYGYESNVIRIYTANQFFEKLNTGSSAGKLYVIMNDIDFDGIDIKPISLAFRGQLFGNNVVYQEGTTTYTRKPILFNLDFKNVNPDENGEMSTSISSIFQNSIGAVFSNFNIVIRDYDVKFAETIKSETIASILVGNAINTSVNNVNVYSSLLGIVNKEISQEGYDYTDLDTEQETVTVSQGYRVQSGKISDYTHFSYLKLATYDSTDETSADVFVPEQFYLNNEGSPTKFEIFKYIDKDKNDYTGDAIQTNCKDEIKNYKIDVENGSVNTNATIVGMFMGVGNLSYISNSSTNLDINILYDKQQDNVISIGSMVGSNIGEIQSVVSTSNITVKVTNAVDSLNSVYVGGLVGNDKGIVRYAYLKNISINIGENIGESTKPVNASSGNSGTFVGGVAGILDSYSTINDAIVGGINFVYLTDCEINAFVEGNSKIGGVLGQNSFTIGDIYYKQTGKDASGNDITAKSINVKLFSDSADSIVGGIVGYNKATMVTNVYTNTSVIVESDGYSEAKIAGIVGYAENNINLTNIVNDAEKVSFKNNTVDATSQILGSLSMGGLVAEINAGELALCDVFNTADIIATQEKAMRIGGMVGSVSGELIVTNGLQLGNIYLGRSKGLKNGSSYGFFNEEYYIGGLAGQADASINQNLDESTGFVVLTSIKDYAIAQKANLNIGPVIGSDGSETSGELRVYYNENISLASNNGYKNLINLPQSNDKENSVLYKTIKQIYDLLKIKVDVQSETIYSNYLNKYFKYDRDDVAASEFYEGSKILPKEFTASSIEDDKYYVLNSNISVSNIINTTAKNWTLNAQGYTIVRNGTVFQTITENSAVIGLMQNKDVLKGSLKDSLSISNSGVIATDNSGFIFSCGVSGDVEGSGRAIASIAFNNYGVISTSFSIANLKPDINTSAAGLVANNTNGDDTIAGNIYCSYYTGTIAPKASAGGSFSGLVFNTKVGFVSSCYTMADIDTSTVSVSKNKVYPVTATIEEKLYKVFYDYVAFTGLSSNEGIDIAEAKEKNYITNKGIYVWSSSLTGGDRLNKENTSDVANVLGGNWLIPGEVEFLIELYKKSKIHLDNPDEEIIIDTSWFNYGYTTNNLGNIIVGGQESNDNIIKYLTMLYTGNGLASKEDAATKAHRTHGFLDYPYKVKHAGILDVLVSSNNTSKRAEHKYYLFVKSIDFIKYTGKTYWSKGWDDKQVLFAGDLDGSGVDGKGNGTGRFEVKNMYSTYGLLRAIPNVYTPDELSKGINSSVRNITFVDCYSKTGIVAGYLGSGVIKNVVLNYCLVYNGDFNTASDVTTSTYLGKDVKFNNASTSNFASKTIQNIDFKDGTETIENQKVIDGKTVNFAGGLVGYMYGGIIDATCSFGNTYVASSNKQGENITTSCIGGIVGVFIQGNVGGYKQTDSGKRNTSPTTSPWIVEGITVSAIQSVAASDTDSYTSENYVGGIAGYVGKYDSDSVAKVSYIQNKSIVVRGSYSIGGIAGVVEDGTIQSCEMNNSTNPLVAKNTVLNKNSNRLGFDIGDKNETVQTIYLGGITGKLNGGLLKLNKVSKSISVSCDVGFSTSDSIFTEISLGGIAGLAISKTSDAKIESCEIVDSVSINNSLSAKSIVTGGIVGIVDNANVSNCKQTSSAVGNANSIISGGIVGKLFRGQIYKCEVGSISQSQIDSNNTSGGVVGYINTPAEENANVTECKFRGTVSGDEYAGGIIGYLTAQGTNKDIVKISKCTTSNGTVGDGSKIAGGIVAVACYEGDIGNILIDANTSNINVKTSGTNNINIAGGIVAVARNMLLQGNNKNSGTISSAFVAGGIIGLSNSSMINSAENSASVSAKAVAGGLVGWLEENSILMGTLKNSSTSAKISTTNAGIAGGIIALVVSGKIDTSTSTNTTNSSAIGGEGSTAIAGGIIGYSLNLKDNKLTSVKNAGAVTANEKAISMAECKRYDFRNGTVEFKAGSSSIFSSGDIGTKSIAGGIVGASKSALYIYNVSTSGGNAISATKGSSLFGIAGGIIGAAYNTCLLTDVSNTQPVNGDVAGGIIAEANSNTKIITSNDKIVEPGKAPETIINVEGITFKAISNSGAIRGNIAGGIVGLNNGSQIGYSANVGTKKITNSGSITSQATTADSEFGAGSIVGVLRSGSISNAVSGSTAVTATSSNAGGIIGYLNNGELISATISADTNVSGVNAGGLVGYMYGGSAKIKAGNQTRGKINGSTNAGGVVGLYDNGIIERQEWSNISSFGTSKNAGGIAGTMNASQTLSGVVKYNVTGGSETTGGIVGLMSNGKLTGSSASGKTITGSGDRSHVGGLVGRMTGSSSIEGDATNQSTGGNVTSGFHAGGIVGNMKDTSRVEVGEGQKPIVGGAVSASESAAGGVVGNMNGNSKIKGVTGGSVTGTANNAGGLAGELYDSAEVVSGTAKDVKGNAAGDVGGAVGQIIGGTLSDATLTGSSITSGKNRGGLVGYMSGGTIKKGKGANVAAGGTNAGGVVGFIEGTASIADGEGGNVLGGANAGGIAGYMKGTTSITKGKGGNVSGAVNAGGIVGLMEDTTSVTGGTAGSANGTGSVGGIVGHMKDSASVSGVTGGSASGGANTGGIAGHMEDSTKISGGKGGSATGTTNTGGIVGLMEGSSIVSSGTGGSATGGTMAGGIAGRMNGSSSITGGTGGTVSGSPGNGGGIVGYLSSGTVSGGTSGKVSNGTDVGGIVGEANSGTISVSPSNSVNGTNAGGAVGRVTGSITLSSNISISISGSSNAGGLIGVIDSGNIYIGSSLTIQGSGYQYAIVETVPSGTIIGSSSTKNINIGSNSYGLVYSNKGTIGYLSVSGTITLSSASMIGAVAGVNSGTINNCSSSVNITVQSASHVGGIAGFNSGNIYNATNTGNINTGASSSPNKTNSYGRNLFTKGYGATSPVNTGGIVGYTSGGTVEGSSSGTITGDVKYSSDGSKATINDPRGKIAGVRVSGSTQVINTAGHTEYIGGLPEKTVTGSEIIMVAAYSENVGKDNNQIEWDIKIERNQTPDIIKDHATTPSGDASTWYDVNKAQKHYVDLPTKYSKQTGLTSISSAVKALKNLEDNESSFWRNFHYWYWIGSVSSISDTSYSSTSSMRSEFQGPHTYFYNLLTGSYIDSSFELKNIHIYGLYNQGPPDSGVLAYFYTFDKVSISSATETVAGLQDCGGSVEGVSTGYSSKEAHEVTALTKLYNLCGPYDDNTSTNCGGSTASSTSVGKLSGTDVSPSGGGGGGGSDGGEGGGPHGGIESGSDSGALTGITLTGNYAARSAKLNGDNKGLANTALQIKQVGTGFVYGGLTSSGAFDSSPSNFEANYYQKKKGSKTWNGISYDFRDSNIYWCLDDVVSAIESGKKWTTDCFGFARLCQLLYFDHQNLSAYRQMTSGINSPSNMESGAIMRAFRANSGTTTNKHVAMYLYHEGNTVYYIDQSGLQTGTFYNTPVSVYCSNDSTTYTSNGYVKGGSNYFITYKNF